MARARLRPDSAATAAVAAELVLAYHASPAVAVAELAAELAAEAVVVAAVYPALEVRRVAEARKPNAIACSFR